MAETWMTVLVVGVFTLVSVGASRILLLQPLFSKSHDLFHDAIARYLLAAGHRVTVFTSMPGTVSHPNYTEVDSLRPTLPTGDGSVPNFVSLSYILQVKNSFAFIGHIFESSLADCHYTIQLDEMRKILTLPKRSFDVLIVDLVPYAYECFLPIAEILDAPVIGTVATRSWRNAEWMAGNPYNPAVMPFDVSDYFHETTFGQKLRDTVYYVTDVIYHRYLVYPEIKKFHRRYFPNTALGSRKKPSLLFLNSQPLLLSRPLVPNVISVGGVHVQPVKPLANNLKLFIEGATKGVILFSFGSMIRSDTMPAKITSIFRRVFARLPQRVIWKSEEKIDGLSDNVLSSSWLPQSDILAHENLVAFVTHGGIAGILEALRGGTPMILIPLFFDQQSNAALVRELGVGVCVDFETLTEDKLFSALNDVVDSTEYASRAKEISRVMDEQSSNCEKNVVFWTEYVIRHNGAQHLTSATSSSWLYEYLSLDIVGFILVSLVIVRVGAYFLSRIVYQGPTHT